MAFISIIMIAYNAEKYIDKALNRLQNQSLSDFEVIMVDDGSSDSTGTIMENFAKQDSRFKLFQQSHQGIAAARNLGISKVMGKYVIHHDADDFMPINALEKFHETAEKSNADLILADYHVIFLNKKNKIIKQNFNSDWRSFLQALYNNKLHAGLWNKLIKRDLYDNLNFEEGIDFMEDKLILTKICLAYQPNIAHLDFPVYNYVQKEDSITNKLSKKTLSDMKKVILSIEQHTRKFDLDYLKFLYKLLAVTNHIPVDYKEDFKEINKKIITLSDVSIYHKLLVLTRLF